MQHFNVLGMGDFACIRGSCWKSGDLYSMQDSFEAPDGSLSLPDEGGVGVLTMTPPPLIRNI